MLGPQRKKPGFVLWWLACFLPESGLSGILIREDGKIMNKGLHVGRVF